jgi:hypothetical protein
VGAALWPSRAACFEGLAKYGLYYAGVCGVTSLIHGPTGETCFAVGGVMGIGLLLTCPEEPSGVDHLAWCDGWTGTLAACIYPSAVEAAQATCTLSAAAGHAIFPEFNLLPELPLTAVPANPPDPYGYFVWCYDPRFGPPAEHFNPPYGVGEVAFCRNGNVVDPYRGLVEFGDPFYLCTPH